MLARRTMGLLGALLLVVLGGCEGRVDFTHAEDETGSRIDSLVQALEASGADPEPFAIALAENLDDEQVMARVPLQLQPRVATMIEAIVFASEPDPEEALVGGPGTMRAAQSVEEPAEPIVVEEAVARKRAAVLLIASGEPVKWKRNLIEFVGRSYFAVHLRRHYAYAHVCSGNNGTWSCFRQGRDQALSNYRTVDVILEVHGAGREAFDNAGQHATPAVLDSPHLGASTYRFGMFMNCYAAAGGWPQAILARGGKAAYGAFGPSVPTSDLVFQSRFGTFGYAFAQAVQAGNRSPLTAFAKSWNAKLSGAVISQKQVFGAGSLKVGYWP